jgi:serine/threonine-protein kinase
MATVWAARMKGSRGFQKIVAVKTMLPSVSDDPQFEQMFLDEAALASRIRHPNVAEILDLGEESGVLFLVMEWVDGESFSVVMKSAARRGGVPMGVALRIVMGVCAGLHAAHELRDESGQLLGVVHRDVSPQNILVTFDGVVKVVDFGVAKAAGRATSHTSEGQVKGKAAYMSPEQAQGAPIDRRTDLFAVGILLYQLTTGKHPFRGENEVATLYNICSEDPVPLPSIHLADYPSVLEPVVLRALAKRADDRYSTASELGRALDGVAREIGAATEEEVGAFVRELLGERQDKRNETLRTALRLADDRAGTPRRSGDLEGISHTGFTPKSSVTLPGLGSVTDLEATAPGSGRPNIPAELRKSTPAGMVEASGEPVAFPKKRGRRWLTALLLLGLVGLGSATYRFARAPRGVKPAPENRAPVTTAADPATTTENRVNAPPSSSAMAEASSKVAGRDAVPHDVADPAPSASSVASAVKPPRGSARTSSSPAASSKRGASRQAPPFVAPIRNPGF